jgi:hypothetical protein
MTVAIKVLDRGLREDFGFESLLWVYSGRRGVHCWAADKRARQMPDEARTAVAEYFSVYKCGPGVTLTARWVPLRARWVTLRARWVTLRARWVTLSARWVTLNASPLFVAGGSGHIFWKAASKGDPRQQQHRVLKCLQGGRAHQLAAYGVATLLLLLST